MKEIKGSSPIDIYDFTMLTYFLYVWGNDDVENSSLFLLSLSLSWYPETLLAPYKLLQYSAC